MEYTVNFLFTTDGKEVLLQRKKRTRFAGMLNGVGGKLEEGEAPMECAIREIREETGISVDSAMMCWLATLMLPEDCVEGNDGLCILHFYSTLVDKDTIQLEPEDPDAEELLWKPTYAVATDTVGDMLAGEGDVSYMVERAIRYYHFDLDGDGI